MTPASSLGLGGSSRHTGVGGPKPNSPETEGGPSPNFSPIAHPVAAAEATQEPVESLMQKFKESFRANTPIEIGQLQSAPRSISAGRRKRRSRPRGRSPGHLWPGRPLALPRFWRSQEERCPPPPASLCPQNPHHCRLEKSPQLRPCRERTYVPGCKDPFSGPQPPSLRIGMN